MPWTAKIWREDVLKYWNTLFILRNWLFYIFFLLFWGKWSDILSKHFVMQPKHVSINAQNINRSHLLLHRLYQAIFYWYPSKEDNCDIEISDPILAKLHLKNLLAREPFLTLKIGKQNSSAKVAKVISLFISTKGTTFVTSCLVS